MEKTWCDDERNVHDYIKYEKHESDVINIYKEVNDYLRDIIIDSKFDECEYIEYSYDEYLSEIEGELNGEEDYSDEESEFNETLLNDYSYAYV